MFCFAMPRRSEVEMRRAQRDSERAQMLHMPACCFIVAACGHAPARLLRSKRHVQRGSALPCDERCATHASGDSTARPAPRCLPERRCQRQPSARRYARVTVIARVSRVCLMAHGERTPWRGEARGMMARVRAQRQRYRAARVRVKTCVQRYTLMSAATRSGVLAVQIRSGVAAAFERDMRERGLSLSFSKSLFWSEITPFVIFMPIIVSRAHFIY